MSKSKSRKSQVFGPKVIRLKTQMVKIMFGFPHVVEKDGKVTWVRR